MIKLWLNRMAHTIAITWFALVMLLAFLLFTPTGLNTLRGIGNYFLEPMGISLTGNISGRINQLSLGGIKVDIDGFQLNAKDIDLSYSFMKLTYGKIVVKRLSLGQLDININDSTSPPTTVSDQSDTPFEMPLPLLAQNISVGAFSYAMNQDKIISADKIVIDAITLKGDLLTIDDVKLLLQGDYQTSLSHGTIRLNDPFDANLTLTMLIPVNENSVVNLDSITVKGPLAGTFTATASGEYTQGDNSQPIQTIATLSPQGVKASLILQSLAKINASFQYDHLSWQIEGESDPALPKIGGNLNGQIISDNGETQIKTHACTLSLLTQSVSCKLDVRFLENGINLDTMKLHNEDNSDILDLFAKITPEQWQFKSNINIANLSAYSPYVQGSITSDADILIAKDQTTPNMDIDLNLANFVIFDTAIKSLHIDTGPSGKTQFNVNLQQPQYDLVLQSDISKLDLEQINITLNQLDIDTKGIALKLQSPSTVDVNWAQAFPSLSITPLCLIGAENNHLCISSDMNESTQKATIQGTLNPILLKPILPIEQSSVNITIDGAYHRTQDQPVQAHLDITAPAGKVVLASLFGDNIQSSKIDWQDNVMRLDQLDSHFKWNDTQASFNFDLKTPINALGITAQINHLNLAELESVQMNAKANISFSKFGWIASLIPTIPAQVQQGSIVGDFTASGKLIAPEVRGSLKVVDAQVYILMSNTTIEDINAQLLLAYPQRSTLTLSSQISGQVLEVDGWFEKIHDQLEANIGIKGSQLSVMNTPDILVVVSPELTFTHSNKSNKLSGSVTVNKAMLNIDALQAQGITNTIQNDVVFADRDQVDTKDEVAKTTPFALQLAIVLDDDITLKGYGLNANLKGNLDINALPDQPLLARGQVDIYKGTFAAYGKAFNIDPNSAVLFNNGPIDNPTLRITAFYVIPTSVQLTQPDVPDQIGIRVTGTAQNPTVTLFSNPSLSPTDILSFILFGQSLSNSSNTNADNSAMLQAALLLAINEGGAGAIDTIRDTFDVAEISVGTISSGVNTNSYQGQGQTNNTAIFIGKQLFTRLYVSYGVGIFTGEQQGIATYSISPQWKLRGSVSDFDNTLTVLYQTHSKD